MADAPDDVSVIMYRAGVTPLDWAIRCAAIYIAGHHETQAARVEWPGAFPGTPGDADETYWARRLMAVLLNAGWTPPQVDGGQSHSVV